MVEWSLTTVAMTKMMNNMDKELREKQINKIIQLIEKHTFRTANPKQCAEVNGDVCSICWEFEKKLKREMRKLSK